MNYVFWSITAEYLAKKTNTPRIIVELFICIIKLQAELSFPVNFKMLKLMDLEPPSIRDVSADDWLLNFTDGKTSYRQAEP